MSKERRIQKAINSLAQDIFLAMSTVLLIGGMFLSWLFDSEPVAVVFSVIVVLCIYMSCRLEHVEEERTKKTTAR